MLTLPSDQNQSGRSLGAEELEALAAVLETGVLTCTKGAFVPAFEAELAGRVHAAEAIACSSGTAAVHAALSCVEMEPGDEVITTPMTDMGAIAPILYQGAIPVFADIDPRDCNVTAATIEARLSARTRAIIVTHLFGGPCDMEPIESLARAHGLFLIEDCAQAFLALYRGRPVGSFGDVACFSLQQGKHVTCGEGGAVAVRAAAHAQRVRMFVNKGWGKLDDRADHHFLALNYRMSELAGAVALAQMRKLDGFIEARRRAAARLTSLLAARTDLTPPEERPGDRHVYWRYAFALSPECGTTAAAVAERLRRHGVHACLERYVNEPAFRRRIFTERRGVGGGDFPFSLARADALDHSEARFPGVLQAVARTVVLPWNERYTPEHADYIAGALAEALG